MRASRWTASPRESPPSHCQDRPAERRSSHPCVDNSSHSPTLFVTIISAIAELERSLVADRVKSGMRRAKLEGRQIGRSRLDVNREQVVQDRRSGMSLTQVAKRHNISRASVCRLMKEANSDCNLAIAIPSGEAGLEARL